MKKTKLIGALLPALVFGAPVAGSSLRSSRLMLKKAVVQNTTKSVRKNVVKKDPFFIFGSTSSKKISKTKIKEEVKDVLAFLEEENLLSETTESKNNTSGDNTSRKDFAGSCLYPGSTCRIQNFQYSVADGGVGTCSATSMGGIWYPNNNSCNGQGVISNPNNIGGGDSIAPTISGITISGSSNANDSSVTFSVDFSEDVKNVDTSDFELTTTDTASGTIASVSSATGDPITVTVNSISGTGSIRLDIKSSHNIKDSADNALSGGYTSGSTHTLDRVSPVISSVDVPANATYKATQNLSFTVNTSENVIVDTGGGTPRLTLTIGGDTKYATYTSGTGSTALVFTYTVESALADTDGIAVAGTIDLNSGTLKDSAGNNLTPTLNSVGALTSVLVDSTAPTVSTYSPTVGATSVAVSSDIVLTFSENIAKGTGNIYIKAYSNDAILQTIDITTGAVVVSGTTATITHSSDFALNTQYYVTIDATAFDDANTNSFAGISSKDTWKFTTMSADSDATTPTTTFNPANSSTTQMIGNDITITFDEAIRNTDDSEITDTNVDSLITLKTTNSSGSDVPFDATIDANKKIITINPTTDLTEAQVYYLSYGNVEDTAGNLRAGENITFTAAADTDAPLISILTPTDNNTTFLADANLSVVFNKNIQVGTGNIEIKYDSNDSVFETFDVNTSDRISISGSTLTIDPTNSLDFNTTFYVDIANTAIKDTANTPNNFAGISNKTDWNFTTFEKVSLSNLEDANISYTEGDSNTTISSLIEIINPSAEDIIEANIAITSNFVSSEDKLHFTDANGITGDFNTTTGILSLTGEADISTYQTALRSIAYENTNQSDINATSRTLDINVTDKLATSTTVQRTIDITAVDDAPTLDAITNQTSQEDFNDLNITLTANDIDGDAITYTVASSDNSIATASIVNGVVVLTSTADASGVISIEVNATANGKSALQDFNFTINAVNDTPTFVTNLSDLTIDEDSGIHSFELNVTDIEGDELNITVSLSDSSKLSLSNGWNGNLLLSQYDDIPLDFNLTTVDNANGSVDINITVDDGDKISSTIYTITIDAVNDAPTLGTISDIYVYRDSQTKSILLNTNDIENDNLIYSSIYTNSELISDINFSENNMTISITDTLSGKSDINVTVNDGEYNVSKSFIFNVLALKEDDSIKENGSVEVDENDTVIVTFDDNITVKAPTKADANGSISHEIDFGDKKVSATSGINGSVVELTDNGVHTTYEDTINNIVAEVNATITGQAIHTLDLNGTKTIAKSEIVGAYTVIKEDTNGSIEIETTVTNDDNVSFKVVAKGSGEAEHTVTLIDSNTTSKAISKIKGAKTIIKTDSSVQTTAGSEESDEVGYIIKALVVTKSNGEAITKFIKVNSSDATDIEVIGNTVKEDTPFNPGNEVTIDTIDGELFIKIITSLEHDLEVE